jgi:hypothetical protein
MRKRILTPTILSLSLLATSPAEAAGSPVGGRYSEACTKYVNLAREVGFPKSDRWMLRVLMHRESRCQPTSIGRNRNTHGEVTSQDWGLLQLNDVSWVTYLKSLDIISKREDLLNPRTNLKAALALIEYTESKGLPRWYQWRTKSGKGSGQR